MSECVIGRDREKEREIERGERETKIERHTKLYVLGTSMAQVMAHRPC